LGPRPRLAIDRGAENAGGFAGVIHDGRCRPARRQLQISATAETSTFSDHILASYPVPQGLEIPEDIVMDMYLSLTQDKVGKIAVHALNVGLLVREV